MGEVYIKSENGRYFIAVKKFNRFLVELRWLNAFWDLIENLFFVKFPLILCNGNNFFKPPDSIVFYTPEIRHYQSFIM